MDDYCKCRQAEALRWIDLREKCASIIARLQPVLPEEYQALRNIVLSESGPFQRRDKKQTGMTSGFLMIKNTCLEWAIALHGMYESFLFYFIINKNSIILILMFYYYII